MRVDRSVNPWRLEQMACQRGGQPLRLSRPNAPVGQALPYSRAAGGGPSSPTQLLAQIVRGGWAVRLGQRGLGDLLLGLALVQAAADALAITGSVRPLVYRGPRARLIDRCRLRLEVVDSDAEEVFIASGDRLVGLDADPERPPTWLDVVDAETVEAYSALPMRYYLETEQLLGVRLPSDAAPAPRFESRSRAGQPFHVVFVTATSWPERKDYGITRFARLARTLDTHHPAGWLFSVITAPGQGTPARKAFAELPHQVLDGVAAVECLDVFGSAELVIGNDTGLTHLAALCERPDGTGPDVIGLYGRHAYTKWTTGSARHHAVATRFSQMMAASDRCPVRERLDDQIWGAGSDLRAFPEELLAAFAGECAGWW